MDKRRFLCLQDVPMFSGIEGAAFHSVCNITNKRYHKKGEFLFRQGDPADAIYHIKEGSFILVYITENGEEVIVRIVGPGEIIGETALMDHF